MKIKDGVRFATPGMAMVLATMVVRDCFVRYMNLESVADLFTVTGGVEQHQHPSKHVYGGGLDYRTQNMGLSDDEKWKLTALVRKNLGDGFDVVLEGLGHWNEHLHVEYDPKS